MTLYFTWYFAFQSRGCFFLNWLFRKCPEKNSNPSISTYWSMKTRHWEASTDCSLLFSLHHCRQNTRSLKSCGVEMFQNFYSNVQLFLSDLKALYPLEWRRNADVLSYSLSDLGGSWSGSGGADSRYCAGKSRCEGRGSSGSKGERWEPGVWQTGLHSWFFFFDGPATFISLFFPTTSRPPLCTQDVYSERSSGTCSNSVPKVSGENGHSMPRQREPVGLYPPSYSTRGRGWFPPPIHLSIHFANVYWAYTPGQALGGHWESKRE